MKEILYAGLLIVLLGAGTMVKAGDDVYDEYTPKRERIKYTQPEAQKVAPSASYSTPSAPENATASFDNKGTNDNYYEEDDNNYATSYSDRIRRFHNPSVQFGAMYDGNYGGYNDNYFDPYYTNYNWYNPGWNQQYYWYTPSSYWDYYNFWNPFSTPVVVINSPWQNNWGWGNDPCSNFGWNNNWYSSWYNPWYNPYNSWWTPTCHNIVSNNWGWDYTNYHNTVYTPRVSTSTNSPKFSNSQRNSTNSNYQYNYTNGNNNGYTINKKQKVIVPQNYDSGYNGTNYKPKQPDNSNSNWNNTNSGNNNWGSHETESGIKVNRKPK